MSTVGRRAVCATRISVDPCGMVVEMKERPQETCYKAWDNTEGLESEARRGSQYHL